jgi:hypothetical protein
MTSFETASGLVFDHPPVIQLSAQLPTITINDMSLAPSEEVIPESAADDFDELAEELEQLAEEGRLESEAAEGESKDDNDVT